MKTAKLQRLFRKNPALPMVAAGVLFVLVVLGVLGAPAVAGPIGAAGDVYVLAKTDLGYPFASPAVLQYDGATGDLVGPFATYIYGQFMGMAWGPNGNLYIVNWATYGNWQIKEYDEQTGAFIQDVVTHNISGSWSVAKGITFGPDGDLYRTDWYYGTITRYDGTTFEEKHTTPLSEIGTPNGMRFAPNGNLLVISGGYNGVWEYDVSDGIITLIGTFASNPDSIQAQDLTFGPNGNLFVALGMAGGVSEFDGVTGAPLGHFVPMDSELRVNGLAFDNFGRLLVADIHPVSRVDAYDAVTGAPMGPFLTDGLGDIGGGLSSIPTIISIKPGLELPLDIKPGECPNSFNPRSAGVLPVALLGSMDFDIMMVDVYSLELSRADGVGGHLNLMTSVSHGRVWEYDDVGTPFDGDPCDCHEAEGDGYMDIKMKFGSAAVNEALLLSELPHLTEVELVVSGILLDGTPLTATDCILKIGGLNIDGH